MFRSAMSLLALVTTASQAQVTLSATPLSGEQVSAFYIARGFPRRPLHRMRKPACCRSSFAMQIGQPCVFALPGGKPGMASASSRSPIGMRHGTGKAYPSPRKSVPLVAVSSRAGIRGRRLDNGHGGVAPASVRQVQPPATMTPRGNMKSFSIRFPAPMTERRRFLAALALPVRRTFRYCSIANRRRWRAGRSRECQRPWWSTVTAAWRCAPSADANSTIRPSSPNSGNYSSRGIRPRVSQRHEPGST